MSRCSISGSRLSDSNDGSANSVSFVNVKAEYRIDEDVIVNYTLQKEFRASTRDWIGIFPKDSSNLQQYLTFEYTLSAPPMAANPSNRTILFPRIFHREALLNSDYQFVYVSKEIQIMATSNYFRFTPLHRNNSLHRCHRITNISTNTEISPNAMANDTQVIEKTPTHGIRPICRYCHRQVCGLKIDALRGDFLATLSDSLLNRVHRLETDLSFAESNAKNAKGARDNFAKRLRAYEAFVAEMLKSLEVRGIVKITDEKGMEIVLQRVNQNDHLGNGDAIKANGLLENEITALKSLLNEQQQTIEKLAEQRKFNDRQRDRINFMDREIQTISYPSPKSPKTIPQPTESQKNDGESFDDGNNEIAIERIVETRSEKLFSDRNSKTEGNENIDGFKLTKKDVEGRRISSGIVAEPMVLKIPKPSGILLQGKNVKLAIVRL